MINSLGNRYSLNRALSAQSVVEYLSKEIQLNWLFIKSDVSTTIVPTSIFMLVAVSTLEKSLSWITWGYFILGVIYFFLYIYQFCLSNQIFGISEDQTNKPFRPLPSGKVTLQGAKYRWIVSILAYVGLGFYLHVFSLSIVWVGVSIYLNCTDAHKSWLTKNLVPMGLGIFVQLAAAWKIITPLTPEVWHWIIFLSGWGALTATTQDFRDIEGDRLSQRQTLPIAFGEPIARNVMATIWIIMAFSIHLMLCSLAKPLPISLIISDVVLMSCHMYIAWRVLIANHSSDDQMTYSLYTYLYCVMLGMSALLFHA